MKVLIFAGSFMQARHWAEDNNIPQKDWQYVTDISNIQGRVGPLWYALVGTWMDNRGACEAFNYCVDHPLMGGKDGAFNEHPASKAESGSRTDRRNRGPRGHEGSGDPVH